MITEIKDLKVEQIYESKKFPNFVFLVKSIHETFYRVIVLNSNINEELGKTFNYSKNGNILRSGLYLLCTKCGQTNCPVEN